MKSRLRGFRAEYGLTQAQIAEIIGVTRGTILSIENGKYVPSLGIAFKLAIYFGVRIEDIFSYEWESDARASLK